MAKIDVVCPRCSETHGVIRNGHSGSGAQLYRCNQCLKTFQLSYRYNGAKPETHQAIVDMAMNGSGCRTGSTDKPQYLSASSKKLTPHQVAQNVEPGAEVVICCEADEQWSYVRCKGNQRWLFYAYDRIQKRVLAHAFMPS